MSYQSESQAATYNPFPEHSELWYTAKEFSGMITAHIKNGQFFNGRKADALLAALVNTRFETNRSTARHFAASEIIRAIRTSLHKTPYKQLLNSNAALLRFSDADKQALLSTVVGYRLHCNPPVFNSLADYVVSSEAMIETQKVILQKCLERSNEKNGEQKAQLYAPFWKNCAEQGDKLGLDTLQKQETLDVLLKYSLDCSKNTYQFFSDYKVEGNFERSKQQKIDAFLFDNDKEYWQGEELRQVSWVLQKQLENSPSVSLAEFQKYSGAYLDMLQAKDCPQDVSLLPLAQWMEKRAQLQPSMAEHELFSEQKTLPETIDKTIFSAFLNQIIDKAKNRNGVKNCSDAFLQKTSGFLKAMVEKHSFSKKEMLDISRNLKIRNYRSDSTEAYYLALNTELQGIYNAKLNGEVLHLGRWAREYPAQTTAERLAVRSTYIDILHERLINDKSVRELNLAEALNERLLRFNQDMSGNFEKDKLKANRIVQAIAGPYRAKAFVKDIRKTALYFDGGKPSKKIKVKQSGGRD